MPAHFLMLYLISAVFDGIWKEKNLMDPKPKVTVIIVGKR